jgi:hypothetical protein
VIGGLSVKGSMYCRTGRIRADECERRGRPRSASTPGKKRRMEDTIFENKQFVDIELQSS